MNSGSDDTTTETDRRDRISVLMPCRDEAAVLAETLTSLLAASECIHEIIFIDDGSRDRTMAIAREMLATFDRTTFVQHEAPVGTAASLQEGLALATGSLVFMGAGDDPVDPDLLPTAITWLTNHPGAGVFSAESRGVDEDGHPQAIPRLPRPTSRSRYLDAARCREVLYRQDSWFAGNTCVYRTEVLKAIGIDPDLGPFCDGYAAWTAALRHGACYVASPLATKRNLAGGAGVGMFRDSATAMRIWSTARAKMERDVAGAFPPALISRMEQRWRYNVARARLEERYAGWCGRLGNALFAVFRFTVALRYKPYDVLNILVRRGGRDVAA